MLDREWVQAAEEVKAIGLCQAKEQVGRVLTRWKSKVMEEKEKRFLGTGLTEQEI